MKFEKIASIDFYDLAVAYLSGYGNPVPVSELNTTAGSQCPCFCQITKP